MSNPVQSRKALSKHKRRELRNTMCKNTLRTINGTHTRRVMAIGVRTGEEEACKDDFKAEEPSLTGSKKEDIINPWVEV